MPGLVRSTTADAARRLYVRAVLVGREPERALLGALVDGARNGTAAAVVVRGDPGVGKSALLDVLAAEAADVTLLRTQGLEVEAPLPFAALHRLLLPLARLRDHLPPPQARALGVAFGEDDGPSVEPFLVGVATLSLLTSAAEEGPVLCIVDDAHWLDPASAGALLFCARRLGADRVAMVFGAREGAAARFEAPGVDEVVLGGLDEDASRALLAGQLGESAAAGVVARLVEEARGNPLALLELPRELDAAQLTGAAPLPAQLHLTERVEQAFLDRSRRLPEPVQRMVLLAAADDSGRLDVVRDAARRLGLDAHALRAAVDSGLLVQTDDVVTLRHPLVRSAIYQAAADDDRRRAEARVAQVGGVAPLAGLAMAMQPDRTLRVVAHFEDSERARQNLRPRARLAVGEAVGRGGSFSDSFRLTDSRAVGGEVVLDLEPRERTGFVLSALYDGPVLFATC